MKPFYISLLKDSLNIGRFDDEETCLSFSVRDNSLHVTRISNPNYRSTDYAIYGLLGVYSLSNSFYLAVITGNKKIGTSIHSHAIFKVTNVEFIKIPSSENEYVNLKYLSMIQHVYSSINIYYSLHEDLTRRLQDTLCEELTEDDQHFPTNVDEQFLFNYPIIQLLKPFKSLFYKNLIPISIYGFMSIVPNVVIDSTSFTLTLISRRSIYRNGRRFNTRGVDLEGNVANFVETEQIVQTSDGMIYSHVQIRGSIPLKWSQKPYLKYTPRIVIEQESEATTHHFTKLISKYGKVIVVNLIDKKKDQLRIGSAFEKVCQSIHTQTHALPFYWFDFHAECKGMHYENIQNLVTQMREDLDQGGFFQYNLPAEQVLSLQNAVVRTNCIDCLDRTNVVQSVLARDCLFTQLFGEKAAEQIHRCFDDPLKKDVFHVFNALWSDNADHLSLFYSASPSLKTDYTRTGKRTTWGALQDGVHSVLRYFHNNFCDGYFDDCVNLVFDRVQMGEEADKKVVKVKKSTFVSFAMVVFAPLAGACYVVSSCVPQSRQHSVFWNLFGALSVCVWYWFGKKGSSLGSTFVSRAILPKKMFIVCCTKCYIVRTHLRRVT